MFNALRPDELLTGIGRVLRMAADSGRERPLADYERSQVLSAFSVTRLLAAEQAANLELLARTKAELDVALAGDERPEAAAARQRVAAATTGVDVGDAITDLFAAIPRDDPTHTAVHRVLRGMVDREVAALARGPA